MINKNYSCLPILGARNYLFVDNYFLKNYKICKYLIKFLIKFVVKIILYKYFTKILTAISYIFFYNKIYKYFLKKKSK